MTYCTACHRSVAREDRVERGGDVYHRQCAPDETPAVVEITAEPEDGDTNG